MHALKLILKIGFSFTAIIIGTCGCERQTIVQIPKPKPRDNTPSVNIPLDGNIMYVGKDHIIKSESGYNIELHEGRMKITTDSNQRTTKSITVVSTNGNIITLANPDDKEKKKNKNKNKEDEDNEDEDNEDEDNEDDDNQNNDNQNNDNQNNGQ